MKPKTIQFIAMTVLLIIFAVLFKGNFLTIAEVPVNLEYSNEWYLNDYYNGIMSSDAILKLPELTSEFSFTVDYNREIISIRDKGTCNVDVDYEIYNFKNNLWEKFHDKSWSLEEYDIRASLLAFDGEDIYQSGTPELIDHIKTVDSDSTSGRRYDSYWGCPDGMSSTQLLNSIEHIYEMDSRYTFKCLYPSNYISEHAVDDDTWENNDLIFFPKLNVYGIDYINNNVAEFRIIIDKKSACSSFSYDDFTIELFDIKTDLIEYFRFLDNQCSEVQLFTYKRTPSDYNTLMECQYQIMLDKWVLLDNQCTFQKVRFTELSSNTLDTQEDCLNLIEIEYYRIENHVCESIFKVESNKTSIDYSTIGECEDNLIKEQVFYRFHDNKCIDIFIFPYNSLDTDYLDMGECEENIVRWYQSIIFFIVIGIILLLTVVLIIKRKK